MRRVRATAVAQGGTNIHSYAMHVTQEAAARAMAAPASFVVNVFMGEAFEHSSCSAGPVRGRGEPNEISRLLLLQQRTAAKLSRTEHNQAEELHEHAEAAPHLLPHPPQDDPERGALSAGGFGGKRLRLRGGQKVVVDTRTGRPARSETQRTRIISAASIWCRSPRSEASSTT